MAVKTIILRPNGQAGGVNLSNFTRVPSDTTDENLYMLVNEAVADDDSTYIAATVVLADVELAFPFKALTGITPTAMRLVARVKSEGILWSAKLNINGTDASGAEVTSSTYAYNENLDVWETITADVDSFESIKDSLADFTYSVRLAYSGSSKSGKAYLTQLYLEVDYDDEAGGGEAETPTLYIKLSGAWEAVNGTVYNKVNGAWVVGNLNGLTEGESVTVKEV